MKNLRQILTTAVVVGVFASSALSLDAQKRDERKPPPPPKQEKVVEKTDKQREQQPRNEGNRGGRDDKRGKP